MLKRVKIFGKKICYRLAFWPKIGLKSKWTKFTAKIGVEKGDNFWQKSKVIALHFGQELTGNKSGQNLWQKLVLKRVTDFGKTVRI